MTASIARSELILGGQKSGKSRRAELLARDWLARSPEHRALLIATAQPWDDEMRARIARHQRDRAERVPGLATLEEPRDLAAALAGHSTGAHAAGGGLPHAVAHELDHARRGGFHGFEAKTGSGA
jgi:adenosylcobinamide kinase/adenosylcobinamide-phosphate guanylyltransferase